MRVGFVVETISSLKVLGPLLSGAPPQAIQPVVFVPHASNRIKPYDAITPPQLAQTFQLVAPSDIHVYKSGKLAQSVRGSHIDRLCLLNPYRNFAVDVAALAADGVAVFGLDYFVNSIYVPASNDDPAPIQRSLSLLAGRVVASDFWRDLEFAVQPNHKKWADRFVSLGSPLIDVFGEIDGEQAARQLNLSPNKPVLSVFTPNIRDHQAYFFMGYLPSIN